MSALALFYYCAVGVEDDQIVGVADDCGGFLLAGNGVFEARVPDRGGRYWPVMAKVSRLVECLLRSEGVLHCRPPRLSQALICRLTVGLAWSFLSKASWSMRSKHLAISASSTHLGFWLILI